MNWKWRKILFSFHWIFIPILQTVYFINSTFFIFYVVLSHQVNWAVQLCTTEEKYIYIEMLCMKEIHSIKCFRNGSNENEGKYL